MYCRRRSNGSSASTASTAGQPHSPAPTKKCWPGPAAARSISRSRARRSLRPRHVAAVPLYRWQRLRWCRPVMRCCSCRAAPRSAISPRIRSSLTNRRATRCRTSRAFALQGQRPNLATCSGDADLIKAYVRAGLGVGIVAETAYRRDLDSDLCAADRRSCSAPAHGGPHSPRVPRQPSPRSNSWPTSRRTWRSRAMRRTLALGEAGGGRRRRDGPRWRKGRWREVD